MLKEVMLENEETKTLSSDFREASDKTNPGLEFIKHTGNIYNGSSPLCLMSLLENQNSLKMSTYYGEDMDPVIKLYL